MPFNFKEELSLIKELSNNVNSKTDENTAMDMNDIREVEQLKACIFGAYNILNKLNKKS